MTCKNPSHDIKSLLLRLGYQETSVNGILEELNILFQEIDFDKIKLKDLMLLLENKGYYRPDFPTKLIKLLVNGLNLKNEDIFATLEKTNIPQEEKSKEQEFLASCAAITQLGYILVSCLLPEIKAAVSGPHVFIMAEGFSPGSVIFIDFSIDSIIEVDIKSVYCLKENYYYLKKEAIDGFDKEIVELLTKYYSFIHVTSRAGLSPYIHNNLGIAYDKIGKYEKAIKEFQEALRLDPGYIEVHNNIAVTYGNLAVTYGDLADTCGKMERFEEAIKELQEAIRLNPAYTEAHYNLGNIYTKLGRYEEGIEELQKALTINPDYAPAHNSLGNIHADQERYQEAIEEFQTAIRLDPNYAPSRYNRGNIYMELGMYEEALKEFIEALKLQPGSPEAYFGIGIACYNLGSYDRAAHAFIGAVRLDRKLLEFVPEKIILKVRQGVSRMR